MSMTWETINRIFGIAIGLLILAGIVYMWLDPMRRWAMGIVALIIGVMTFALTIVTVFALGADSGLSPFQALLLGIAAVVVFVFGLVCVKTSGEEFL